MLSERAINHFAGTKFASLALVCLAALVFAPVAQAQVNFFATFSPNPFNLSNAPGELPVLSGAIRLNTFGDFSAGGSFGVGDLTIHGTGASPAVTTTTGTGFDTAVTTSADLTNSEVDFAIHPSSGPDEGKTLSYRLSGPLGFTFIEHPFYDGIFQNKYATFLGGTLTDTGSGAQIQFHYSADNPRTSAASGSLSALPASVPETSTLVSFGLLLGAGSVIIALRRKKVVA